MGLAAGGADLAGAGRAGSGAGRDPVRARRSRSISSRVLPRWAVGALGLGGWVGWLTRGRGGGLLAGGRVGGAVGAGGRAGVLDWVGGACLGCVGGRRSSPGRGISSGSKSGGICRPRLNKPCKAGSTIKKNKNNRPKRSSKPMRPSRQGWGSNGADEKGKGEAMIP